MGRVGNGIFEKLGSYGDSCEGDFTITEFRMSQVTDFSSHRTSDILFGWETGFGSKCSIHPKVPSERIHPI